MVNIVVNECLRAAKHGWLSHTSLIPRRASFFHIRVPDAMHLPEHQLLSVNQQLTTVDSNSAPQVYKQCQHIITRAPRAMHWPL